MKDYLDFALGVITGAGGAILISLIVLIRVLLNIPDEHNPD